MATGVEQYGQCSGQREEASATSVYGLGGGIDHQPVLDHPADELADVVADVRPGVALSERGGDLVQRAVAVAQLEHARRRLIQAHRALRDQQEVLLAHVVVAQAGAGGEPRAVPAGTCGWVSPRSMASSCAHSTSVLNLR